MRRIKRLCISLRKPYCIMSGIAFIMTALLVYYNFCSLLMFARVSVQSSTWTDAKMQANIPGCSVSSTERDYKQTATYGRSEEVDTFLKNHLNCAKFQGHFNQSLCRNCTRPAVMYLGKHVKEIGHLNYLIPDLPAGFFKARPDVVGRLVTNCLIVPSLGRPYLLALQASILGKRNERDAVRSTWGSVSKEQTWPNRSINANVKVVFVVARHCVPGKPVNGSQDNKCNVSRQLEEIKAESDLHQDILFLDMIDTYQNLTLKLLSAFKWVKDNCPCVKFVLKVDYDTFVNVPLLVDTLLYFENRFEFSILGMVYVSKSGVKRWGKWAVPEIVYPMVTFPEYASGCGYVLSCKVLSKIVDAAPHVPMFSVEDAFITGVMRRVIGCQLFSFQRLFTHYKDKNWYYCWMFADKKILGMSVDGHKHKIIWDTFVKDSCA